MNFARRYFWRLAAFVRGLSLWGKVALVIASLVVIAGAYYLIKGSTTPAPAEAVRLRTVSIAKISDLENNTTPLPLIGEVKSLSEASIRSESGGSITRLYRKLGSYVAQGAIIAEIDNASQRAALLQAEGILESAQAGVDKSGKLFSETKKSAFNAVRSVYSSNDDIVRSKLDVVFRNPTSDLPVYIYLATDSNLVNKVQNSRVQIRQILAAETARDSALSENSDLQSEIKKATEETRLLKDYVDDISALLNASIPSNSYTQAAIDAHGAVSSAARSIVSGSLASLAASSQALIAAQTSGDAPSNASASDAAIKTAQGAYNAANASLEKTIIRAPISGTLNNLSIKLGDFVSPSQEVAVVSNNGSLEIVAFITPEDRRQINVGTAVLIEREYKGSVTSVAPAIDPITKKIEIKISFAGKTNNLTNGESVHLDIARAAKKTSSKAATVAIPISAVKIQSDGSVVFTVDETHHLVAQPVTTGVLIGDKIQILSPISADTMIVTDARGLKNGQEVTTL